MGRKNINDKIPDFLRNADVLDVFLTLCNEQTALKERLDRMEQKQEQILEKLDVIQKQILQNAVSEQMVKQVPEKQEKPVSEPVKPEYTEEEFSKALKKVTEKSLKKKDNASEAELKRRAVLSLRQSKLTEMHIKDETEKIWTAFQSAHLVSVSRAVAREMAENGATFLKYKDRIEQVSQMPRKTDAEKKALEQARQTLVKEMLEKHSK